MQSKAKTVDEYLAGLSDERRAALSAVRDVILKNIGAGFEEGMQYGMIGYFVPHSVYPAGYHCDPRQPLPYAGLASQKNHMSLYMCAAYGDSVYAAWLTDAWKKTGKKLNMGKACIRFKKLEDLPLDLIGEAFRRVSVEKYIAACEQGLAASKAAKSRPAAKKKTKKAAPIESAPKAARSSAKSPKSTKPATAKKRAKKKSAR